MVTKEWIGGFISGEGCFTGTLFQITLSNGDE